MPARQAKEPLSRERILAAAVAIADADGMRAVTMRRIAEDLDCEAMSLYHYFKNKPELLAGMTEVVIGEVTEVALGIQREDWRDAMRERCLAARRVMLAHPWAPALINEQDESPPVLMVFYEEFVGTLIRAGFSYDLAHRAIHVLGSMVLGFTHELFEPAGPDAPEVDIEAMMEMAKAMPYLSNLARADIHDPVDSLSMCDTQQEFEFTLNLSIDGLESHRKALA